MFVCLDAPSPAALPSFPFSLVMTSAGGRPPRAPIAASPLRVAPGSREEQQQRSVVGRQGVSGAPVPLSITAWRPQKQQL